MAAFNSYERKMVSTAGNTASTVSQRADNFSKALDQEIEWYHKRWHEVAMLVITLRK